MARGDFLVTPEAKAVFEAFSTFLDDLNKYPPDVRNHAHMGIGQVLSAIPGAESAALLQRLKTLQVGTLGNDAPIASWIINQKGLLPLLR
jgi:hypothetical protein